MKLILALAWRNIWRNRRRTLLTIGAIASCVTVLVFFSALQLSSYATSIGANVSIFQGFAQIQHEDYNSRPDIRKSFPFQGGYLQKFDQVPLVEHVSARAMGFALLSSSARSYGAQIVGVVPDREPLVSTIPGLVQEGSYLKGAEANEIYLGEGLARNLRAGVGSEVTLLGQARDGSVAASILTVVGVFRSGSPEVDRGMAEIPLEVFQDIFTMDNDIHSLVFRGIDVENSHELVGSLRDFLAQERLKGNLSVLHWEQLLPGVKEAIELDMATGWIFYLSLVIVVSFLVLNTFLMSVIERTREFGVMLAVGLRPFSIALFVFIEVIFILVIGCVVGVALGAIVVQYFNAVGFSIPGTEAILEVWNMPHAIYPYLSFFSLTAGPFVVGAATLFAVLYPLARILLLRPVEALRAPQ